jgi:hypothetical protein
VRHANLSRNLGRSHVALEQVGGLHAPPLHGGELTQPSGLR